jgi:MFS family permease
LPFFPLIHIISGNLLPFFRESGCNPFATSIIADYFDEELRGSAIGVYNWGIYIGYSLSYAIGNAVTQSLVGTGRYADQGHFP